MEQVICPQCGTINTVKILEETPRVVEKGYHCLGCGGMGICTIVGEMFRSVGFYSKPFLFRLPTEVYLALYQRIEDEGEEVLIFETDYTNNEE